MRAHRKDQGFTLVEVLVAMVLTIVGLLGVSMLLGLAMQATRDARDRSAATLLARQLIAKMQADPGDLDAAPPGTLEANVPGFFDVVDRSGRAYEDSSQAPFSPPFVRRWSIAAAAEGSGVSAWTLSVRVIRAAGVDGASTRMATAVLLTGLKRPR